MQAFNAPSAWIVWHIGMSLSENQTYARTVKVKLQKFGLRVYDTGTYSVRYLFTDYSRYKKMQRYVVPSLF